MRSSSVLFEPWNEELTAVAKSEPANRLPPVFGIMLISSPPVMLSALADE